MIWHYIVAEQRQDLQRKFTAVDRVCKKWGMAISIKKVKSVVSWV